MVYKNTKRKQKSTELIQEANTKTKKTYKGYRTHKVYKTDKHTELREHTNKQKQMLPIQFNSSL